MKTHSKKFLQQRRFYMALPILTLPFITMIFWALGGGQGTPAQAQVKHSGLNLEVPGAHFGKEDELWDKFTLYEQAKRDSIKREEAKRNDPYYVISTIAIKSQDTTHRKSSNMNTSLGTKDRFSEMERNEQLINQKLELLTQTINQPEQQPHTTKTQSVSEIPAQSIEMSTDVDRLEKMMETMANGEVNDPEMQQIEGVLDKILDIQHPDRIKEKIREQSLQHRQQVYPVKTATPDDNISIVQGQGSSSSKNDTINIVSTGIQQAQNSFYGLEDEADTNEESANSIEAVIHDNQTVVAGSTVKMRLLSDVFINGQLLEKDQFIYGTCAIRGERLTISINSIRNDNSLFPVALSVYDLDGMEGIFVPGAITRDAAKQAGSQSVQDLQLYSMDNSIGVQAATAGIEAAKGLFSKKAKLIKITLKAGYRILLQDTNQQT
jgi:conjugative transposon TraM protein